jgi:hypothetical protein
MRIGACESGTGAISRNSLPSPIFRFSSRMWTENAWAGPVGSQVGHASGNSSPTRAISLSQAVREVSCERGL